MLIESHQCAYINKSIKRQQIELTTVVSFWVEFVEKLNDNNLFQTNDKETVITNNFRSFVGWAFNSGHGTFVCLLCIIIYHFVVNVHKIVVFIASHAHPFL